MTDESGVVGFLAGEFPDAPVRLVAEFVDDTRAAIAIRVTDRDSGKTYRFYVDRERGEAMVSTFTGDVGYGLLRVGEDEPHNP